MATAKSIIIDVVDNYGYLYFVGLRSVEFKQSGVLIALSGAAITCYESSKSFPGNYGAEFAFDTTTSKTGSDDGNGWLSSFGSNSAQRIICVCSSPIEFDEIVINNYHNGSGFTSPGAQNIKINVSSDAITDTTYNAAISNSELVYDGGLDEHIAANSADDQSLTLIASGGEEVIADTLAFSLSISLDSEASTVVVLPDEIIWGVHKDVGSSAWNFTPSPEKLLYNVGDEIASYANPVFNITHTGVPISDKHNPCGYWWKNPAEADSVFDPPDPEPGAPVAFGTSEIVDNIDGADICWLSSQGGAYGRFYYIRYDNGYVNYTDDGFDTVFTRVDNYITHTGFTIEYIGSKFFAFARQREMRVSSDGTTWASASVPFGPFAGNTTSSVWSVSYNSSMDLYFMVMESAAVEINEIFTSSDGINWTLVYSYDLGFGGIANLTCNVEYGAKQFFADYYSGLAFSTIDGGATFTAEPSMGLDYLDGAYARGFQGVVGFGGNIYYGGLIFNGIGWSLVDGFVRSNRGCARYDYNSSFGLIGIDEYNGVWYCHDGVNFTKINESYLAEGCSWGNDRYVIVGQTYSTVCPFTVL